MMDYPFNLEDGYCNFLVIMYLCLNVKPLKIVCAFHTKICDWFQTSLYRRVLVSPSLD